MLAAPKMISEVVILKFSTNSYTYETVHPYYLFSVVDRVIIRPIVRGIPNVGRMF